MDIRQTLWGTGGVVDKGRNAASCDTLERETRELMKCFLGQFTGALKPSLNESQALSTMTRCVQETLEKHRYAYNGIIKQLSLSERGYDVRFVSKISSKVFSDGKANWGRIVSLAAFGAVVCQSLKEMGRDNCIELVGEEISAYLMNEQKHWLVNNNSWEGFVEFFRVADRESAFRNTLLAFVVFAGITATLKLLMG